MHVLAGEPSVLVSIAAATASRAARLAVVKWCITCARRGTFARMSMVQGTVYRTECSPIKTNQITHKIDAMHEPSVLVSIAAATASRATAG